MRNIMFALLTVLTAGAASVLEFCAGRCPRLSLLRAGPPDRLSRRLFLSDLCQLPGVGFRPFGLLRRQSLCCFRRAAAAAPEAAVLRLLKSAAGRLTRFRLPLY